MEKDKEVKKRKLSFKTLLEKDPALKCLIITFVAVIFIGLGFIFKSPLLMIIGLLPAAFYEAYRTWGITTKLASIILCLILIFEAIIIIFNIHIDLAKIFGFSKKYISGYGEILIDIKTLIPLIIIFLSVLLIVRTIGPYTKWLSLILIAGCFCLIYILYPTKFNDLFKFAVKIFIKIINWT
jgi:hypothetical protein